MNKNNNDIANYIGGILHETVKLELLPAEARKSVPMLYTMGFDLMQAKLFGQSVLFACMKDEVRYSPMQLQKMAGQLQAIVQMPVVYVMREVMGYYAERLIQRGVNFIHVGKQMYMPHLLIDIHPVRKSYNADVDMPPMAQVLVLYHLQKEPVIHKTMAELTSSLQTSYATINKAISWLRNHDLVTISAEGKQKYITMDTNKRQVWTNAKPYLSSPVARVLYAREPVGLLSGENALAHYTMMVETPYEQRYAVAASQPQMTKEEQDCAIEIWRYSPEVLASGAIVDALSLYLSMEKETEERISIELDNMLNKILD